MFEVSLPEIQNVLTDFGVEQTAVSFSELQRHHYERNDPNSKQVRLICKAECADGAAYVIRFKNEDDVTEFSLERQSEYASLLYEAGIPTPKVYRSSGHCIRPYCFGGYEVWVAVEDYVPGELKEMNEPTARQTGCLLARMHNLAEQKQIQVDCPILFNPLGKNDLFDLSLFRSLQSQIDEVFKPLYEEILALGNECMNALLSLRNRPKYAVQGDMSICNLYRTSEGDLGVFDFNWCGDSVLIYDAVMQGMFEARLMDYPDELGPDRENIILDAFWDGYCSVRSVTPEERDLYPSMMALLDAFWLSDLKWDEDSLTNLLTVGNSDGVRIRLTGMKRKLLDRSRWKL